MPTQFPSAPTQQFPADASQYTIRREGTTQTPQHLDQWVATDEHGAEYWYRLVFWPTFDGAECVSAQSGAMQVLHPVDGRFTCRERSLDMEVACQVADAARTYWQRKQLSFGVN
jgi:hypothetical protein